MKFSFQALGTTWWVEIWDELPDKTQTEITDFCLGFVNHYEQNYSRFKPDSLISTLNRERIINDPNPELIQLLEYGKQLYLRSDTHFNFLTGHILEARGYDADYSFTDSGSSTLTAGNPVTDLTITPKRIELLHGNVDLGGYGKGFLIDLLAKELKCGFSVEQLLINGGGDMYITHKDDQAVTVHLEHPTKPGIMIGSTALHNQGFAASSPHKRHWPDKDGNKQNHIIADTITYDATFIKTTSAADADAFATAALQLNQQQLEQLAKSEELAIALFDQPTSRLVASQGF